MSGTVNDDAEETGMMVEEVEKASDPDRGGQKYLGYFGPFWTQKVPGSTPRYLEFLLTNTSINLRVMGNSTFRIARRNTGRQ